MTGHLYIVTAPSGAGKTTLVRLLLENDPDIRVSISHSTRAPRSGEREGVEYHFVSVPDFLEKVRNDAFLEWAEVHGNYYGTSRSGIEAALLAGQDVLLEIDWQGAQQVRALFPAAIGVFVLPPHLTNLNAGFARAPRIALKRSLAASLRLAKRCGMWRNSTMLLSMTNCSVRCTTCWRWSAQPGCVTLRSVSAIPSCSQQCSDYPGRFAWHE
jgi:guanylate kinase